MRATTALALVANQRNGYAATAANFQTENAMLRERVARQQREIDRLTQELDLYALRFDALHPTIQARCKQSFAIEDFEAATMKAWKTVETALRRRSTLQGNKNLPSVLGELMAGNTPVLRMANAPDRQEASYLLFRATAALFRNAAMHDEQVPSRTDAFHQLVIASKLLGMLDEAETPA